MGKEGGKEIERGTKSVIEIGNESKESRIERVTGPWLYTWPLLGGISHVEEIWSRIESGIWNRKPSVHGLQPL